MSRRIRFLQAEDIGWRDFKVFDIKGRQVHRRNWVDLTEACKLNRQYKDSIIRARRTIEDDLINGALARDIGRLEQYKESLTGDNYNYVEASYYTELKH